MAFVFNVINNTDQMQVAQLFNATNPNSQVLAGWQFVFPYLDTYISGTTFKLRVDNVDYTKTTTVATSAADLVAFLNSFNLGDWSLISSEVATGNIYKVSTATLVYNSLDIDEPIPVPAGTTMTVSTLGGFDTVNLAMQGINTVNIDWGDGVVEPYDLTTTPTATHTYPVLDLDYTIAIDNPTALTYLACNGNQLTTLDVSANTALDQLDCSNNQLTTLDVSANTALNNLYCSGNQLTTLDVSASTALVYLDCNGNQLTSLDVSASTALNTLTCSGNQLTSLDVSNNTALTYLTCYINQLTTAAVNDVLAFCVAFNTNNNVVSIQSQTPAAPPTGQGIIDKATLQSRAWTVDTD